MCSVAVGVLSTRDATLMGHGTHAHHWSLKIWLSEVTTVSDTEGLLWPFQLRKCVDRGGGQWCPSSVPRLWSGLGVPLSISTQTMELLWHTDSLPLEDRHAWMDGHFFISKRELYWKKDYTYSIESTEQTSKKLFFKYVKRKMLYEFQNYISVTGLFHKAKLGCERICQSNVFCVHFHFHSLFYFFSEWKYNNTSVIKKIINAPTVTVSWSSPLKHNQPSFYCITFCLESAF